MSKINVIPIIDKIVLQDSVYWAINASEEVIFITHSKEIAELYYVVPSVLEEQAKIIHELSSDIEKLKAEFDKIISRMVLSGSGFVH